MAEITAGMVRELREKTDAPMMECKKALTEAGGDLAKAEEILRIKLGNKASKAAGRVAAEGVVAAYIASDGKLGAIVEVNCETDFVAKNDEFLAFAAALARARCRAESRRRRCALAALRSTARPSKSAASALVGKIGENMSHAPLPPPRGEGPARELHSRRLEDRRAGGRRRRRRDARQGHRDAHRGEQAARAFARRGARPRSCRRSATSPRPRRRNRASPRTSSRRWSRARSQKFLKEVTLLGQPFVKNDKQTIERAAEDARAPPSPPSRCISSAKASRSAKTISPPK